MATVEVVDVDEDEIVPVTSPPLPPRSSHSQQIPSSSQPRSDLEQDELAHPFVDIHHLFTLYNQKHFNSILKRTYVEYSTRMTLCAGTCTFKGRHAGCRIALSEPLLKYRPRSDLLSTLLHEMIHAYLFETEGVAVRDGPDGHGPKFMSHANRINLAESGKVNITPYHTFTDEVDLYRVHHWACNLCGRLIKRAMNRAPAPRDPFWPMHEKTCGGVFIKTKEPGNKNKKTVRKRLPKNRAVAIDPSAAKHSQHPSGVMRTHRIDAMLRRKSLKTPPPDTVPCPCCNVTILKKDLNTHLDTCLTPGLFSQGSDQLLPAPQIDKKSTASSPRLPSRSTTPNVSKTDKRLPAVGNDVEIFPQSSRNRAVGQLGSVVSKRSRTESEAMKEIIPNRERFSVFAADPSSMRPSCVKDLVKPASMGNHKPKLQTGSDDVVSILRDVTKTRNTPHELQKEAEIRIRERLARDVDCIEVSADERVDGTLKKSRMAQIMESKGRLGQHGTRSLHASEVLELIGVTSSTLQPSRSAQVEDGQGGAGKGFVGLQRAGGSCASTDPERLEGPQESRTRSVGRKVIEVVDDVIDVDLEQDSTVNCPVCDSKVARASLERHVNNCLNAVSGAENERRECPRDNEYQASGNCPICDCVVPREQLESHVNRCLNDADMANFLQTSERDMAADSSAGCRPTKRKKGQQLESEGVEGKNLRRCPLCDLAVPRDGLQDHVSRCMLSSGLEDAF